MVHLMFLNPVHDLVMPLVKKVKIQLQISQVAKSNGEWFISFVICLVYCRYQETSYVLSYCSEPSRPRKERNVRCAPSLSSEAFKTAVQRSIVYLPIN